MTFHVQDRTITGSSGYNAYQATYQRLNAWIRFRDVAITLALCRCPVQNVYLQALMQAETLLVSGTSMTITGAGGQDLLRYTSS